MSTSIYDLLRKAVHVEDGSDAASETVTVQGWIRTSRFAKRVTFIHLYDGSTDGTIQIVIAPAVSLALKARLSVGAAIRVTGQLVPSPGPEQPSEVKAAEDHVEVVGDCDASMYPVQKKEATPDYWRTILHLRARTAEFQRIFRARSRLSQVVHQFFNQRGFHWVHTPIITFSDCEGAGEMFRIRPIGHRLDRFDDAGFEEEVHFFGKDASLTVSGQLEVETFCMALGKVYTFGPTFRAENSHTSRHASEFWMIEPEIAFASVEDVVDLAEQFILNMRRALVLEGMASSEQEAQEAAWRQAASAPFMDAWSESGELPTEALPKPPGFVRCTYTEAMEILAASGRSFDHPIGWGESLQSEHERFLAEEHFKGPVFVTHYPIEQKPFYMRVTDGCDPSRQTVECFDLLVPGVGEIIGGSAREERLDKLLWQMDRCGIDEDEYSWYVDLRKFGSVPHGGFGLGFERALMWLLGVENIRDVLPFPRTPA